MRRLARGKHGGTRLLPAHHVLQPRWPVVSEKVSSGHCEQIRAPCLLLNCPRGQGWGSLHQGWRQAGMLRQAAQWMRHDQPCRQRHRPGCAPPGPLASCCSTAGWSSRCRKPRALVAQGTQRACLSAPARRKGARLAAGHGSKRSLQATVGWPGSAPDCKLWDISSPPPSHSTWPLTRGCTRRFPTAR